ncbi:MAG: ABC transporter ATP-binding protein/permease [Spirochaetota bacterium]|nr:ABC transporter ATP-binding protein/permease [Spirochaetota bacterium]
MKKTFSELLVYLKPYKLSLFLGLTLLIFSAVLEILNPKIIGMTIDELNTPSQSALWEWVKKYFYNQNIENYYNEKIELNAIYFYVGLIIFLMLIRGIVLYYTRFILIGISRKVEYDIRNKLFNKLLYFEPAFFDKHSTGDLISRMTSDLEQIRMIYGPGIMYTVNVFFLFIFAMVSMISIDPLLTLLTLLPLILLAYIIKRIGKKYYEKSKLVQEELAKMTTFVNENLQGIRVIKSYVKEGFILNMFQKINLEYIKKNMALAKLSGIFRPLLILIAGISSILILTIGGSKVIEKKMTIGNLIEYLRYIEILSLPLMGLGWVLSIFQRGNSAYNRLETILNTKSKISDQNAINNLNTLNGNLKIKNLSFSYDNSKHFALTDINFEINNGDKVAIIGPTGSGKTTLVSLLLRLYEPPPFTIFIDNIPINHIPLKTLRKSIGYVPQENFIFPDTILENIRFGSNDYNNFSKIIEVSKMAQFADDIDLFPNAYKEVVGERGITLSGGQKQRLGIARALSGEPNIFIFDDSFSNIDSKTEKQILDNINQTFKKETVIIIAHRPSTIQNIDKIIVLDHGRIKEIGSHDELIKMKGFYANLLQHEILTQNLDDL